MTQVRRLEMIQGRDRLHRDRALVVAARWQSSGNRNGNPGRLRSPLVEFQG